MIEAFNIMQDRITRARLAGDPPDIIVNPPLSSIGWFDFHRAAEAIEIGAAAAEKALEPIEQASRCVTSIRGARLRSRSAESLSRSLYRPQAGPGLDLRMG